MVDSLLRRSTRLREVNNGFKASSCSNRKCLACTPNPPTLSIQTLQLLGSDICKLNQEEVSEEALIKKRRQSIPIAPKKARKNPENQQTQEVDDGGQ